MDSRPQLVLTLVVRACPGPRRVAAGGAARRHRSRVSRTATAETPVRPPAVLCRPLRAVRGSYFDLTKPESLDQRGDGEWTGRC